MFYYVIDLVVVVVVCLGIILKVLSILTKGRCKSHRCLIGKTALISGGTSGIGLETALSLASRGCRVIIAGNVDVKKSKQQIIEKTGNANVESRYINLASFESVREFAKDVIRTESKIDYLINNAGISCSALNLTKDGLQDIFQINFFGHFLLTHLLIDILKRSKAKIIFTSSFVAIFGQFSLPELTNMNMNVDSLNILTRPYSVTKFCINISTAMLAERLSNFGIVCCTLHPGLVSTNIFKTGSNIVQNQSLFLKIVALFPSIPSYLFGKTPAEGAETIVHIVCLDEKESKVANGRFFADCTSHHWMSWLNHREVSKLSKQFKHEFWTICENLVKLQDHEKIPDTRESNFG